MPCFASITGQVGLVLFLLAPPVLAGLLFRLDPRTRRVRPRSLLLYVLVMGAMIYGALRLVAFVAMARVPLGEVAVVLWFMIAWRLAWALWTRTVARWGQHWVRWGRMRRRQGGSVPIRVRLIVPGRVALTALVFFSVFLSTVLVHRPKLLDGHDPQSLFNMPFEHCRIDTADGLTLDGWFIPQPHAADTILICHGAGANKGNFIWFVEPLSGHGFNLMLFDFRAHGASDGRTITYGLHERRDVIAAVDWLKRHKPEQARRIIGLGSSQGAMALALAAAEEPRIDAVILDSPFTSPRELAMRLGDRLPLIGPVLIDLLLLEMSAQTGADFRHASAVEAVGRLGDRPLLVIHGDDDFLMPREHSQRLHDAASGPAEIWFGPGPHSNIATTAPRPYADHVFGFLERYLPASP